jgi:hypothetical protein
MAFYFRGVSMNAYDPTDNSEEIKAVGRAWFVFNVVTFAWIYMNDLYVIYEIVIESIAN